MEHLARRGAAHPDVIRAAQNAVRWTPERNDIATMGALLSDVRARMRYTPDPLDTELVKAPWESIRGSGGPAGGGLEPMDCDDATVLLASMLAAVGIPNRFVVVAAEAGRPNEWSHVYLAARTEDGIWVDLDPIVRNYGVGDAVPRSRLTSAPAYFPGGLEGSGMIGNCNGNGSCAPCQYKFNVGRDGVAGLGFVGLGADKPSAAEVSEFKQILDSLTEAGKAYLISKNPKIAKALGVKIPKGDPGATMPSLPTNLVETPKGNWFQSADGRVKWKNVALAAAGAGALLWGLKKAKVF